MTPARRRARNTASRRPARRPSTRSGNSHPGDAVLTPGFGTDGLRGAANVEVTPDLALALGRAAARVLARPAGSGGSVFVVGRDTRRSGPMLQGALVAGLASEGVSVVDLGVAPTPVVAWVAEQMGVPAAVVSASHNPFADNGVKLFGVGGAKLAAEVEERLTEELDRILTGESEAGPLPSGAAVGSVTPMAIDGYLETRSASSGRLAGLQVVLDCANGAASWAGPEVLRRAGVRVTVIHDQPDGVNINDRCGSTHPGDLQSTVVRLGADAGFAFDGDADRVLAVDAAGEVVDGDQMIALCALDRRDRGLLRGDTVVVTVMSNLGFREAMAANGIAVEETAVGDRHVLERMEKGGWVLGGEQSGHVVFADLATTGDGILTALEVLGVMTRTGRNLADLAAVMTRFPQILRNVAVVDIEALSGADSLWAEIQAVEAGLGSNGRVLVRPSGTEPVVRVMVEAHDEAQARSACATICAAVAAALGGKA